MYRARPENKILVGVTPGPHEPNVDTINNFLEPMVHELLSLWNCGVSITDQGVYQWICQYVCMSTSYKCRGACPKCLYSISCMCMWLTCSPQTWWLCWYWRYFSLHSLLVWASPITYVQWEWVFLVCSHWVMHILSYLSEFPLCTRHEHKHAAKEYLKLKNPSQRQKFLRTKYEHGKPSGYRHSILLCLPYWDPAKMVIVDPMHCLFLGKIDISPVSMLYWLICLLGLVDWQFHTVWVEMKHLRPKKELKHLQKMVESVSWNY